MASYLSFLAPAAAALLGAWAGARFALRRFKAERSFDRWLEWHLSALKTLHSLKLAHRRLDCRKLLRPPEYQELRDELSRLVAEARAFMPELASMRVRLLEITMWDAEDATREAIRTEESLERIIHLHAAEMGPVQEIENILVDGVHRLMPPQSDFSPLTRVRSRIRRLNPFRRRQPARGIPHTALPHKSVAGDQEPVVHVSQK
jgi:hypothetical protein